MLHMDPFTPLPEDAETLARSNRLMVWLVVGYLLLMAIVLGFFFLAVEAPEGESSPPSDNGGITWRSLHAGVAPAGALYGASHTAPFSLLALFAIPFCLDKRESRRCAVSRNTRENEDAAAAAAFLAAIFGGEPNEAGDPGELTAADLEVITSMNKRLDETTPDDIDVRAHLIEGNFTAELKPDLTTAKALKALGEALEWAWNDYQQKHNAAVDQMATDGGDGAFAARG